MILVYLAVAWTAGIVLAKAVDVPWQVLPLLGLFSLLGLFLWREDRRIQAVAPSMIALVLGAGRLLLATPRLDASSLTAYHELGWVTLQGVVVGEPDERDSRAYLRVRARQLLTPDGTKRDVNGLVLVGTDRYPRRGYGDRVQVEGLLETPPDSGSFSYRSYLAGRGVHSVIWRAQVALLAENEASPLKYHLLALKRRAQASITDILAEPQAALLSGILLGVETGIPEDVMDDFSATGTTHLIAISGFNVTILAGIFLGLARRVTDRRKAIWVAMIAVGGYTAFVGASPAVVRAAAMGLLYLFGRYVGRPNYAPTALAAAAIGMTAWNPHVLWDIGFLLSFAATAGLMLYTEPLKGLLKGALGRVTSVERAQRIAGFASEVLLVTLAAQVLTVPILLVAFEQLSLVSLVSNLLVLPVQPYLMVAGGIAMLLDLVAPPLGQMAGWIAWVFLTYTLEIVRLTADLPYATVAMKAEPWMCWAYYALVGGITWWLAKPVERRRELWDRLRTWFGSNLKARVLVGASAILLVLAVSLWWSLPDGRLHVAFLDVGQGDAILIQSPSGRQVLIDGGPSPSVLLSRLGRRMPLGDRSIDLIALTHPDADHIAGLVSVLERYEVEAVVFREMGCDDSICERWRQLVEAEGAAVYRGEEGLRLQLDDGLRLDVLHPGAELLTSRGFNENSLVLRLTYGEVSILLTGDVQASTEQRLLKEEAQLASTVLKVAHHGSCDATTDAFLQAVDPQMVVISVGEENDFDHPCSEVLERLSGRAVYRTDEHGTVTFITDGRQVWVETERLPR